MTQYERRHQDDLNWWIRRYKALCTTKTEEMVRKAIKWLNEATRFADKASRLATELDKEADEAEREITRLGGAAVIESLKPMIEERQAHLANLYESLKNWRPVETSEDKPSK